MPSKILKKLNQIDSAPSRSGSTLVLSVVILATILASAITFAVISLSNFKQSVSIDDAIVSYYLAEAGVERGAYYFRQHNINPVVCGVSNCELEIDAEDKGDVGFLAQDESAQLDIYSPDSPGYSITKLVPTWEDANPGFPTPSLEISFVGWEAGSGNFSTPYKVIRSFGESGSAVDLSLSCVSCDLYRVRFKALLDNIRNLQVEAQNSAGEPQSIPGVFEIKAIGNYSRSKQAAAIITSYLPPLSGLYDYLIFSEEDIIKSYCGDGAVQGTETCDDGSQCRAGGLDCTAVGDVACYYPDPDNPGEFITVGDGRCLPRNGDDCSAACEVE